MFTISKLSLSFGEQKIYDSINLSVGDYDRIGLVGRNGMGKSTLLKVIAGQQQIDHGTIQTSKQKKIAYLPQELVITSDKNILDEAMTAFENIIPLTQEKEALEKHIKQSPEILDRYATVCAQLLDLNPEACKAEAKKILMGLGFKESTLAQPVSILSGGWKMRLVLAKLLLQKADFYLFDEPTNHLDIVAKDWFFAFLSRADFGFIMVCHERFVLNKLCTKVIELELGKATIYNGNYDKYEEQKEAQMAALEAAYFQQQRELKAKMATVDRFKAKATKAVMAQSMLKKIEKIEKIELPPSAKTVSFQLPAPLRPGKTVLKINNVSHQFDEKLLFKGVSFEIDREEKVAIIAPNGVGKSTLFNLITGKLPLQKGSIEYGLNVKAGLFEQEQERWLQKEETILHNLQRELPQVSEQRIRAMLGAFLFSGDDAQKHAGVLSGGEKSRIGMVRLILQNPNLFLLDEPTNHLDIISKDILLKALQNYQGTILFVSHDHDFINKLANRILELTPEGAISYLGNYEYYLLTKALEQSKTNTKPINQSQLLPQGHLAQKKKSRDDQKRIAALERTIEKLEKEKEIIENSFETLRYESKEFQDAQEKIKKIVHELERLTSEWESLI